MDSSKQIKWGAILSYISIGLNILAGLLYTPWMINQIGQSQYGLYTLSNSLIVIFLVDFGLSSATARYVSKYRMENKQEQVNNFLGIIYKLYLVVDIVIFAVFFIIYLYIDKIYVNLTPDELQVFKIVYAISAIFSILNFPFVTLNGILTAYEKFVQLKLADVIYRIIVILFTVVALLKGMGIYALVGANALAGIIITLYKLINVIRSTPVKVNMKYSDKHMYGEVFKFSFWATIGTLAGRLVFNITPTILGVVSGSKAIAIFGIIATIEGYTYLITSAINGLFMPRISKLYTVDDGQDNLNELLIKVGNFQYFINGMLVVGFTLVGREFINLWVGPEYYPAYWGVMLVILPGLFYNSLQIANTSMIVKNKVKLQSEIDLIIGIINIIFSPILSYKYGVIGASASIFIAYTARTIICNIVYNVVLHYDIVLFIKNCYIKMTIPMIISCIIGFALKGLIGINSWLSLMTFSILIGVIYTLLVFMMSLSKSAKKDVFNMILRK